MTRTSSDPFAAVQLREAFHLLTGRYPFWFVLHLLLAGLVPIGWALMHWISRSPSALPNWIPAATFVAAISGSFIGRVLMFAAAGPRQAF
jgi:hypothetical protein